MSEVGAMQPSTDGELRGLTDAEVLRSRSEHGANELTPPPKVHFLREILEKFDDTTIKILLGAAAISLGVATLSRLVLHGEAHFIDGVGILVAVFLATMVGYYNEKKSNREFELLNKEKDTIPIKVTRNGSFHTIKIQELVVGDIVHLGLGDKVPADGLLLGASGLSIDESMLTGESKPSAKSAAPGQGEGTYPANRVYRGTMVQDGHGVVRVTEVGDKTETGKIAGQLARPEEDVSPLKEKLEVLANQISLAGTIAAILIFSVMSLIALFKAELLVKMAQQPLLLAGAIVLGLALAAVIVRLFAADSFKSPWMIAVLPVGLGVFLLLIAAWGMMTDVGLALKLFNELLLAFVVAVTIVVVAVPEGLPMMVNVSLALNMRKMFKENCLVRKLMASETIGSADVICSDKTGTLTQNRMRPIWFYLGGRSYVASEGEALRKAPEWDSLVRNMAIDSQAKLEVVQGKVVGMGNATEASLLTFLHEQGIDYGEMRRGGRLVFDLAHDSDRKRSLALIEDGENQICYMKGAPELILQGCSFVSVDGKPVPIVERMGDLQAALDGATQRAQRVLAFSEKVEHGACACQSVEKCMACPNRMLTGFVGIEDPVRPEVPEAIATCRSAGIEVKMLTGDDPQVATAIARQCGILKESDLVMTGKEFRNVEDALLPARAAAIRVMARCYPQDKLRLVKALRAEGHVVAVTGDGTNDAAALKAADVGLSMGSGTEVAKEASDIVLMDDNFKSVVTGVRWGRALYENIQRFLQFQLSVNVVALLSALIGPLVGVNLPLTVPQLLWINIIMDTFAAFALSTEPPRERNMKRPPTPRSAHILTPSMMVTILIASLFQVAVLQVVLLKNVFGGKTAIEELTIFFTVFVMFQFWHKFNCRSLHYNESPFQHLLKNPSFVIIVATITVVQVVMVQVGGPIGELFRTVPLRLETWLGILGLTATILPVGWFARLVAHLFVGKPAVAGTAR